MPDDEFPYFAAAAAAVLLLILWPGRPWRWPDRFTPLDGRGRMLSDAETQEANGLNHYRPRPKPRS